MVRRNLSESYVVFLGELFCYFILFLQHNFTSPFGFGMDLDLPIAGITKFCIGMFLVWMFEVILL